MISVYGNKKKMNLKNKDLYLDFCDVVFSFC